eukprot:gene22782-29949_t
MDNRSIDDEDFDYDGPIEDDDEDVQYGTTLSEAVHNQPHDEEVALSDTGSLPDTGQQYGNNMDASLIESDDQLPSPSMGRDKSSPVNYTQDSYANRDSDNGDTAD